MKTKQAIILRKDLKMPLGKAVAQGAHASGAALLLGHEIKNKTLSLELAPPSQHWLENSFTKICLGVDSEAELDAVYKAALDAGLPAVLITDNGLTVFNGVPTKTAVGIGPCVAEELDKVTGHLSLLK